MSGAVASMSYGLASIAAVSCGRPALVSMSGARTPCPDPSRRNGHELQPHLALRRASLLAFGRDGGRAIPHVSPSRLGRPYHRSYCPHPHTLCLCFLEMNRATRFSTYRHGLQKATEFPTGNRRTARAGGGSASPPRWGWLPSPTAGRWPREYGIRREPWALPENDRARGAGLGLRFAHTQR